MLQASAQAVDFKVGRHFGEGQVARSQLDSPNCQIVCWFRVHFEAPLRIDARAKKFDPCSRRELQTQQNCVGLTPLQGFKSFAIFLPIHAGNSSLIIRPFNQNAIGDKLEILLWDSLQASRHSLVVVVSLLR